MNAYKSRCDSILGASAWLIVGIPLSVVLAVASRDATWSSQLGWFPLIFLVGVIVFALLFGPGAVVIGFVHAELMDAIATRYTKREQVRNWSIATGALLAPLDLVPVASMFDFVSIGLREIAVAMLCGGVCGYYGAKWALTSPVEDSTF